MHLRWKMVLLLSVLSVVLITTTVAIKHFVVLPRFVQIENTQATSDVTRCREALRRDCEYLSSIAHDWAAWDDSYQYVQGQNAEYEKQNLIVQTFSNLKINLLAVTAPDGRLFWGEVRDLKSTEVLEVAGLLEAIAREDSPLVKFTEPSQEASGLVMTARGPMIVSGRPVVTSEAKGPVRGAMIMGKFLDEAAVDELSQRTQVSLQLHPLQGEATAEDREIAGRMVEADAVHLHQESQSQLHGYAVIRDVYGQPLLLLQAEIPRTISMRGETAANIATITSILGSTLVIALLWFLLQRFVVRPLGQLTAHAMRVGAEGDLQAQLNLARKDEIGILAGEFDRMVRRLAEWHAKLTETAREAGMAEVAIGVLHNVGNVLNSVNTSAGVVMDTLQRSEVGTLGKVNQIIEQNAADLPGFLTCDERGKTLPAFLGMLSTALENEHQAVLREMGSLAQSLDHVSQVINLQQSYCGCNDLVETTNPADLVERAITMCIGSGAAQRISVVGRFDWTGPAPLQRHKVLQILTNLLSNARNAVLESGRTDGKIEVAIEPTSEGTGLRFTVTDNGVGIQSEDLLRLFAFGFSRRSDGHGYGLHSSANLAREMGGSLAAESDGAGQGATFRLDVPLASSKQTA